MHKMLKIWGDFQSSMSSQHELVIIKIVHTKISYTSGRALSIKTEYGLNGCFIFYKNMQWKMKMLWCNFWP